MPPVNVVIGDDVLWPLVQLFLFVFGTIGLTHIIVDSNLFRPARDYLRGKLPARVYSVLECYQCSGTWCGFVVALLTLSYNPLTVLVGGFAGSFLASLAAFVLNYLEANTILQPEPKDHHGG